MEVSPFAGSYNYWQETCTFGSQYTTSLCCVVPKLIEYKLNFMFFVGVFQELGTSDDYVHFDLNIFFNWTDIILIIFFEELYKILPD